MADRGANIDIFFRNGLREYEVLPPADVWDNIRPNIPGKKTSSLLLRAAAVTGIILSAGFLYYYLSDKLSPVFTGQAITLNQESRPEGIFTASYRNDGARPDVYQPPAGSNPAVAELNDEKTLSAGLYRLEEPSLFTLFIEEKRKNSRTDLQILTPDNQDRIVNFDPVPEENTSLPEKSLSRDIVSKISRWRVGAMIAPTYYSTLDLRKDEVASALASTENPSISYSGGFSFGYSLSRRFVLQTGVYYSAVEQEISGIAAFSGFSRYNESKGSSFSVLTTNGPIAVGNSDIFVMNSDMVNKVITAYTADVFDPFKSDLDYVGNSMIQSINFIEIPLVLRYKFIDRRLGLNVVGGISYNLLLDNSAYMVSGGNKSYIGKTDGLSPISFTSSIGMGMEYNLTSKLSLNLEPTFRYYVTPLGDLAGSSVHPYSFGILSGVSYKF